jgi:hypothetical protein
MTPYQVKIDWFRVSFTQNYNQLYLNSRWNKISQWNEVKLLIAQCINVWSCFGFWTSARQLLVKLLRISLPGKVCFMTWSVLSIANRSQMAGPLNGLVIEFLLRFRIKWQKQTHCWNTYTACYTNLSYIRIKWLHIPSRPKKKN